MAPPPTRRCTSASTGGLTGPATSVRILDGQDRDGGASNATRSVGAWPKLNTEGGTAALGVDAACAKDLVDNTPQHFGRRPRQDGISPSLGHHCHYQAGNARFPPLTELPTPKL